MRRTVFDLGKTFTITIVMLILPFIVGIINIGTVVDYKLGVATFKHAAPTFIFFAAWAFMLYKSRSQLIPLFISLLYWGICSVGAAYIANVTFSLSSANSSEAANKGIISVFDNILLPVYGHCVFFDEPDRAFYYSCSVISALFTAASVYLIVRWFVIYSKEKRMGIVYNRHGELVK